MMGSSRSRPATASMRLVTRYWCRIGTTGRSTPIISPTSRHHVPAAFTTCSASTLPPAVFTRHPSPPAAASIDSTGQ